MAVRKHRVEVSLPDLSPFEPGTLGSEGDYDGLEFRDLDLSGQDAANARFLDCGVFGCRLDGVRLRRAHVADCVWADLQATSLDWTESSWRDVVVQDCRVGALTAPAAELTRIRVSGGKYDYINLRASTLNDVTFEGCRLGEIDLGQAEVHRVTFIDCRMERLNVAEATLSDLDLSRSELHRLEGIGSLSGTVISQIQLTDLAPIFAQQLGVRVVPDP